jgi:ABC-type dipeptide/oligopeptide/nickel transport system permease component
VRNALIPSVTLIGIAFGGMLGGSVVIETVFSLPGIGFMATTAIEARDYALVQGYVLFVACAYVLVNLIVDLSYHTLHPAIRAEVFNGYE